MFAFRFKDGEAGLNRVLEFVFPNAGLQGVSLHCSKFKKKLFVLCFPPLILTISSQISGQNKSEAGEPDGLVKITYGIVASSLFKRAGNSNW